MANEMSQEMGGGGVMGNSIKKRGTVRDLRGWIEEMDINQKVVEVKKTLRRCEGKSCWGLKKQ